MHPRIAVAALASAALFVPDGVLAAQTVVSVSKSGETYSVTARSTLTADRDTIWRVLTDYEAYPAFVPNLSLSRIVNLDPRQVEQKGEFGFLFFNKEIHATLQIEESPPSRILVRAIEGDLKSLETELTIEGTEADMTISYRSKIVPDFWLPPLIGGAILRVSILDKLEAVAEEIERRAAAVRR
jgi:ribosome-associated toxin RatA of RatAB toxin-antitoxin module